MAALEESKSVLRNSKQGILKLKKKSNKTKRLKIFLYVKKSSVMIKLYKFIFF